jgi:hypothetical protein
VPNLERLHIEAPLQPPLFTSGPDFFEQARDLVSYVVQAIETNQPLPNEFPNELLSYFNNFGQRLRDEESILLRAPGTQTGANYTRAVRKQIVLLATDAKGYQAEAEQLGKVVGIRDEPTATFDLRLRDERKIESPFQLSMREAVATAYRDKTLVRVLGIGTFDRNDRLEKFDSVSHFTPVEDGTTENGPDMDARLNELQALQPGWLDGEGEALNAEGLTWLRGLLRELVAGGGLPPPYLYPTPAGEVEAEWTFRLWEINATFDLLAHRVAVLATNTEDFSVVPQS